MTSKSGGSEQQPGWEAAGGAAVVGMAAGAASSEAGSQATGETTRDLEFHGDEMARGGSRKRRGSEEATETTATGLDRSGGARRWCGDEDCGRSGGSRFGEAAGDASGKLAARRATADPEVDLDAASDEKVTARR